MKKVIVSLGSAIVLVLLGLKVAMHLGYVGPPSKELLGTEAIQAMEEYCAFVADVKKPEDVKAAEAQEMKLRRKAEDSSIQYSKELDHTDNKVVREADMAPIRKFLTLHEKFQAEVKRYKGLSARAFPDRPGL